MTNKKKSVTQSPIQQLISYTVQKDDKSTLSLPISETENIDIEVKYLLSADDMVSFVSGVTNALFNNDEYIPAVYWLVYAKALIAYYTNLKVSVSNKDIVDLVYEAKIIEKIDSKICQAQKDAIIDAIHKNIEFKKQEILNMQSIRLEKSIRQIELLTDTTSKMAEQFKGIDMKQIAESSIKLANISEKNLVDSILNIKHGENPVTGSLDEESDKNV